MINFSKADYNRQDFLFAIGIILAVLIGFWNFRLILPIFSVGLFGYIIFSLVRRLPFPSFAWTDLCLLSIVAIELVTYQFSIYKPNSLFSLEKSLFFVLFYCALRLVLAKQTSKQLLFVSIGGYALILSFSAFLSLILLQNKLTLEGWPDASQLKRLFSPFQLLNNEWATMALCLLPFPLITAVIFRASKITLAISLVAFAMVNVSALVSFSRGAYLSLGVFWGVAIVLFFSFKLLKIKPLTSVILSAGLLTILLIIPISTPFFTTLSMNKTITQQRSTQGRLDILESGLCQAKDHQWMGVGGDNYPLINHLCQTPSEDTGYSGFTNNTYLQILIEKGTLGVIAYGLFFLMIIVNFFRGISQQTHEQERLINALLLTGLITFGFRELFFSTLFYSNSVLVLAGIFAAMAHSSAKGFAIRANVLLWVICGIGLLMGTGYIYYEKYRIQQAESFVNQAITQWNKGEKLTALSNAKQAIALIPEVAPYQELAGLIAGQTDLPIHKILTDSVPNDSAAHAKAVSYFESALQLNPFDAGYHFNLGCLYFLQNHRKLGALNHVNLSLQLEPNNAEFLLGRGILLESLGDTMAAFAQYEKVIRIDPEVLDSEFFADLRKRHPSTAMQLLTKVTTTLQKSLATTDNTIFTARLGRLLIEKNEFAAAKKNLAQAIEALPDLSRPYYYLALIAQQEGDTTQSLKLLRKSAFLDANDYLAPLALGNLYYGRQAEKSNAFAAIRYFQDALRNWLSHPTLHRPRAVIKYKTGITINNDLIIKSLLTTSYTQIDFNQIANRMVELHKKLKKDELAKHYQLLSTKAISDIKIEDIQ